MDSWLSWWEREGRAAFSAQHPNVAALYGRLDPENGLDALGRLPPRILTTPFDPAKRNEFWLGRDEALQLAREGKVRLRLVADSALARVLDPKAEP